MDVVLESLNKLQEKLQGEMRSRKFLWNEALGKKGDKTKWSPKDENSLSDYVAVHLREDIGPSSGLVINREVEIRPGEGGSSSQRTDNHIVSRPFSPCNDQHECFQVIIEVKCSWHKEFYTSAEDQLANRYLLDNECDHGIYLAAKYYCSKWRDDDSRKSASARNEGEDLEKMLHGQAELLSSATQNIKVFILDVSLR